MPKVTKKLQKKKTLFLCATGREPFPYQKVMAAPG